MAEVPSLGQKVIEMAQQERDEAAKAVAEKEERFRSEIEPLTRQRDEAQAILDRLNARDGATSTPRRRGRRRKGQPTRAEQFVQAVKENPGLGTAEYAKMLDMHPNYLYRIVGQVEEEGLIRKDGRALHPTEKVPA